MPKCLKRARVAISNLGHCTKKRRVSDLKAEKKEKVSHTTSLDLCKIACEPTPSIPVIQETLDLDNKDLDGLDSDPDLDLDLEPDLEPPTWNEDPGAKLDPIEGYESCQACFGDHIAAVELDGFDGDNRDNGSIGFNCSAIDALPAHLRSPASANAPKPSMT
ncbi:hypothetical protein SCLCIDRAFT_24333 [Scleroderma citrinum Foug A]|uniref:Uncharacterized protein n=1 Tax=Scleroderma citrinum Foug A TaxID=1036808 RepID=A0A0C3E4Q5_9AGAM|nr:hypothetical protein SCLCIDRAFT_24333 [Scleroderma citrinum Foug A]